MLYYAWIRIALYLLMMPNAELHQQNKIKSWFLIKREKDK